MTSYWDEFDAIDVGGDARHSSRFVFEPETGRVEQTIHDPDGHDEWRLVGVVDLESSRTENRLVASLVDIVRL